MWRLTAAKNDDGWSLIGCTFDQQFSVLFSQATPDAAEADSDGEKLADKIVAAMVHGRSKALEMLKASFLEQPGAGPEGVQRMAEEAMASMMLAGGSFTMENVETKSAGKVLADRSYLVRCKRGAFCIRFLLYRPNGDWKVLGFHFHPASSFADLLGEASLETPSP